VVHPNDPNTILIGGIVLYRSRDGGQTWDNIIAGVNGVSTYADHRSFSFSADGKTVYMGSDGGVFKTQDVLNDPVNWTALNDTLNTVLFYPQTPISIAPSDITTGRAPRTPGFFSTLELRVGPTCWAATAARR
jgi:hypothetical protein